MRDARPQFVVYARVASSLSDASAAAATQKALCLDEVTSVGGRIVGEYVDFCDGTEAGPELERLVDDIGKLHWHRPTVLVERLSRVSRDIDVLRYISRCIHDLDGQLRSCSEPTAAFQSNPRWPASTGQTMLLEVDAALEAAERFGATIASHIRVESPVHFEALCKSFRRGELLGARAIDKIAHKPEKLPSARHGIEMLNWLADGDVDGIELENAFVDGLVGELLLHINVRSGK